MTDKQELTAKELLTEMRVEVVLSHVATMPIPLYYKIKEQLTTTQQALDKAVRALEIIGNDKSWQPIEWRNIAKEALNIIQGKSL